MRRNRRRVKEGRVVGGARNVILAAALLVMIIVLFLRHSVIDESERILMVKKERHKSLVTTATSTSSVGQLLNTDSYSVVNSTTFPSFQFAVYEQGDIVSNHAKRHGAWEGGLSNVMMAILGMKPGPHQIVDFGTHVGWFSLLAASKGHKSIGIEAMKTNRGALLHSMQMNPDFAGNIELYAAALGKYDSPKELCIASRGRRNFGNGMTENAGTSCKEPVPVATLDEIVQDRDVMFMKADCEGCEGAL